MIIILVEQNKYNNSDISMFQVIIELTILILHKHKLPLYFIIEKYVRNHLRLQVNLTENMNVFFFEKRKYEC